MLLPCSFDFVVAAGYGSTVEQTSTRGSSARALCACDEEAAHLLVMQLRRWGVHAGRGRAAMGKRLGFGMCAMGKQAKGFGIAQSCANGKT